MKLDNRTEALLIRMTQEEKDTLMEMAYDRGLSMGGFIRFLIKKELKGEKGDD